MLINKDGEKLTKEYVMMGYMPYNLRVVNEKESKEGHIIIHCRVWLLSYTSNDDYAYRMWNWTWCYKKESIYS